MSNTVEPQFQRELQKRELKIEHYRQQCAQLQELNADLRVELTVKDEELNEALRQLEEARALDATFESEPLADDTAEVS